MSFFIHHREFLNFVLLQDAFRLPQGGACGGRNQIYLGHHLRNRAMRVGFETQITVGQNAHQFSMFIHHRNTTDSVFGHQIQGLAYPRIHRKSNRIHNHPALGALDLADFLGLPFDAHILVNHAQSPVLCNGNSHFRLGNRVHRCRDYGDLELDIPAQAAGNADIPGQYFGIGRQQKDVIVRQAFPYNSLAKIQHGKCSICRANLGRLTCPCLP